MRAWGEVLVAVRDQRGQWVDCMGRLHHGDFVGLRRQVQLDLRTVCNSNIMHGREQVNYFHLALRLCSRRHFKKCCCFFLCAPSSSELCLA